MCHFIDTSSGEVLCNASESHRTKAHLTTLMLNLFMKETYSALTAEYGSDVAGLSVCRKSYSGILP